jgi:hypothetical protein
MGGGRAGAGVGAGEKGDVEAPERAIAGVTKKRVEAKEVSCATGQYTIPLRERRRGTHTVAFEQPALEGER